MTADREQLWLQTSEGPRGTIPKTQVIAKANAKARKMAVCVASGSSGKAPERAIRMSSRISSRLPT